MELTPDTTVYWQWQWVTINATLVNTWIVMALLVGTSWLVTRRFGLTAPATHAQTMLEALVAGVDGQIRAITQQPTQRLLPFVGTLFLFIAAANLLSIVPGFRSPTGSLSTTAALATCVFLAVPLYGIATRGLVLRWSSLVVMLAAVAKVFLFDTAHLRDLYRVLSFFGLGVSLLLLAFLYQRFVFARPAGGGDAPAAPVEDH